MLHFSFDSEFNGIFSVLKERVKIVEIVYNIRLDFLKILLILNVYLSNFCLLIVVNSVVNVHFIELFLVASI